MVSVQEALARHAGSGNGLGAGLPETLQEDMRLSRALAGGVPAGALPVHRFRLLLALAERQGPEPLARAARRLLGGGVETQQTVLGRLVATGAPGMVGVAAWDGAAGDGAVDPAEAMLARLFLEPFLEEAAARLLRAHVPHHGQRSSWYATSCPVCGAPPQAGYLVDVEGGEGALFLHCSLCHSAWRYARMRCMLCGATGTLVQLQPEGASHVRLDVCERCRGYLKVFDLRVDGRVVPPVDDLATVSLDLFALGQGLSKPSVNLAGV
ncbi:MAG: formate dehydrogenase accessory protein FdhE [Limnochordaceae bacterium]|nr:formate dehydrogenase accessory protein FdhE [Limnochordaceae bacterium]